MSPHWDLIMKGKEIAVILIDKQGRYLGDWRTMDIEGVRQVCHGT